MRRLALAALVGALAVVALGAVAGEGGSQAPQPRISFVKGPGGTPGLHLTVYVAGELERAWKELGDPRCGARLFGNVKRIRRAQDGEGLWDFYLDSPLGEKRVTCRVRVDHGRREVTWRRVGGDLARFEGAWRVQPAASFPGHVRAEYESYIDPGGVARLLLTERRRERMVREMIPRLRAPIGE